MSMIRKKAFTALIAGTRLAAPALVMFSASARAQGNTSIATVVKIAGIQWFDHLEEGVKQYAEDTGTNAFQIGPAQADPQQRAALIEGVQEVNGTRLAIST